MRKHNVPVAMKPYKTLKGLVHPKDRQEKEDLTECVYKVLCANCEGGPKRLKSDSCEAESCFPGYRIIETTANGSDLFEAIAHQLVAVTYNIPTPSHIIRSVLISMFARIPQ